jgi:S1-C subfamily serine protease
MSEIIISHQGNSSLAGREQRFPSGTVRLGRRPDNQVVFDADQDRSVSGHHAEAISTGSSVTISDLGSANGVWVNGRRIGGPTTLQAQDVVRLGENGPEMRMRVEVVSTSTPNAPSSAAPLPGGGTTKQTIGVNTLENAISAATMRERSSSRRSLVTGLIMVLAVVAVGGGLWWNQQRGESERLSAEQARIGEDVAQAKTLAEAANAATKDMESRVSGSMSRYEQELTALSGKISDGEGKVARLIVEIQQRDQALDAIKKRQDLTEEQRQKMLAETESKLAGLKADLKASETKLREETKVADWAGLAEKYQESLFLVVHASKPDANGAQSIGIGTAFAIRADGILATNAHVVDPIIAGNKDGTIGAIFVIQNHSGKVFDIKRVAKHPQYGAVNSPDVGAIQIDPAGATFTAMPLADDANLRKLRIGTQLGTMGYPGELLTGYLHGLDLKKRQAMTAHATFKDGWIGRITDYQDRVADHAGAQWIQHSASLSGGTSGSPMFTSDGLVVAVNNSGIDYHVQVATGGGANAVRTPSAAQIGHAVRVDVLASFVKGLKW